MLDRKGFIDAAAKVQDQDQLKNDSWGLTYSSLSLILLEDWLSTLPSVILEQ